MINARVIMACADALWAIQEEKLEQITAFIRLRLDGGTVSAEDLARITKTRESEVANAPGGIALLPSPGPRLDLQLRQHRRYAKTGTMFLEYDVLHSR